MKDDRSEGLSDGLRHYISWCRDDLLPLWERHGVDRRRGGFFEQLHFDGTPDQRAGRRIRVSARQIYAFAHASLLGWMDAGELVNWGVDYLAGKMWRADGEPGFAHRVDADGHICDARRDLYDHAFHILAFSYAYRATNDAQILALAKQTLAFVDEAMGAPDGSWFEGIPLAMPRRQNPHMHMYEALLALYEASGEVVYLQRADAVASLLAERFMDSRTGLLFEYFEPDLTPKMPPVIIPGHMAEWCWLLHYRAALTRNSAPALAQDLGHHTDKYGAMEKGFLLDAYSPAGIIQEKSRRLWPQTEWLKSMCARLRAGDADMQGPVVSLLHDIHAEYLDGSMPGLWVDQFDTKGQPMADFVPASVVYHLVSAAAVVQSIVKENRDVEPCR